MTSSKDFCPSWDSVEEIVQKVGSDEAMFYLHLINQSSKITSSNRLVIEGVVYFGLTSITIKNLTTFTYHKQRRCIKSLKDRNLINVVLKGIPAQNYFTII